MIKAMANVKVKKDLTKTVQKSLQSLSAQDVYIGIPEGQHGDHEGITDAQLMYVLTHGVRKPKMRAEMDDYMGVTPGGMPITRDFNTFSDNMQKMPYSQAYDLFLHEHGSALWQIPPRPILEPAINNSKDMIAKKLKSTLQTALAGKDPTMDLHEAGQAGVNAAQNWFINPLNEWPPNSPVTIHGSKPDKNGKQFIKGKGVDKPNIDTEMLRRAIVYVVAKKS